MTLDIGGSGMGTVVRIESGKATQPGQLSSGLASYFHSYSELLDDTGDPNQDASEP